MSLTSPAGLSVRYKSSGPADVATTQRGKLRASNHNALALDECMQHARRNSIALLYHILTHRRPTPIGPSLVSEFSLPKWLNHLSPVLPPQTGRPGDSEP